MKRAINIEGIGKIVTATINTATTKQDGGRAFFSVMACKRLVTITVTNLHKLYHEKITFSRL